MKKIRLKDLLSDTSVNIEYRTNSPLPNEDDMLFGYCMWDGFKLHSVDNDSYSVDDVIQSYRWDTPEDLVVWFKSEWI